MSKISRVFLIILGIFGSLFILFIVARIFNLFQYYRIPTTSMDPTFKAGDIIYGSRLFEFDRNNVVAYMADPAPYENERTPYRSICRIIGEEGDKVELKNGLVYLNDKMIDNTMNLSYIFNLKLADIKFVFTKYDLAQKVLNQTDTSYEVNLSYAELKNYGYNKPLTRVISSSTEWVQPERFGPEHSGKSWTLDDFGPVVVPEGHIFLLGDNRSNSVDSRSRGFASKDKLLTRIKE